MGKIGLYELNPRGNLWAKDDTAFGQKMLRKMGWSDGKGLGKNETGNKDPIQIRTKMGNAGVGYNAGNLINVSNDDYEGILKTLGEKCNIGDKTKVQSSATTSLQARSQHFRNRLHYKKYVRGKDICGYSERDMKSIFLVPPSKPDRNDTSMESNNCFEESNTLKSSVNSKDYFAMRLQERNNKTNLVALQRMDITNVNDAARKSSKKTTALVSNDMAENIVVKQENAPSQKSHESSSDCANVCDTINQDTLVLANVAVSSRKRKVSSVGVSHELDENVDLSIKSKRKKPVASDTIDEEYSSVGNGTRSVAESMEVITQEDSSACNSIDEKSIKKKRKKSKQKHQESFTLSYNETSSLADDCSVDIGKSNDVDCMEAAEQSSHQPENSDTNNFDQVQKPEKEETISENSLHPSSILRKSFKKLKNRLSTVDATKACNLMLDSAANAPIKHANKLKQIVETGMESLKSCLKDTTYYLSGNKKQVSFSEDVIVKAIEPRCALQDTESSESNEDSNIAMESKSVDETAPAPVLPDVSTEVDDGAESDEGSDVEQAACMDLPQNPRFNAWLESQKTALKMQVYHDIAKNIKRHRILKTSSLLDIKGYGNWKP